MCKVQLLTLNTQNIALDGLLYFAERNETDLKGS